jgi:hypothetical protein
VILLLDRCLHTPQRVPASQHASRVEEHMPIYEPQKNLTSTAGIIASPRYLCCKYMLTCHKNEEMLTACTRFNNVSGMALTIKAAVHLMPVHPEQWLRTRNSG